MAPFAPTFIIQQGCNAIMGSAKKAADPDFLTYRVSENQNVLRLPPPASICFKLVQLGSIWFNLVSVISPQGCVQTGPIGAIRFGSFQVQDWPPQ